MARGQRWQRRLIEASAPRGDKNFRRTEGPPFDWDALRPVGPGEVRIVFNGPRLSSHFLRR